MTPLAAMDVFRAQNEVYKGVSMTYAGRLDPMAEGVLLVLAGDSVHQKDELLRLDKEYEAEILLGVKTDTFDVLGVVDPFLLNYKIPIFYNLRAELKGLQGDFTFSLPPYSSYKIQSKPFFQWAREGRLDEIKIPIRTTKIYEIELLGERKIDANGLSKEITEKINLVKGDFRQEEIKTRWNEILKSCSPSDDEQFKIVKIRVNCSSGTYIRAIADKLGGCLLGLKRTRVGDFRIKDAIFI